MRIVAAVTVPAVYSDGVGVSSADGTGRGARGGESSGKSAKARRRSPDRQSRPPRRGSMRCDQLKQCMTCL